MHWSGSTRNLEYGPGDRPDGRRLSRRTRSHRVRGGLRIATGALAMVATSAVAVTVTADTAWAASKIGISASKHLVGNETVSVSGSGLGTTAGKSFTPDSSATIEECAKAPGTCITLASGVPLTSGGFSGVPVTVEAGAAGPVADGQPACGVSAAVTTASGPCSIEIVGSPSGTVKAKAIAFNYPTLKLTPSPKGSTTFTLTVTSSSGFPLGAGDPVEVTECDSQNASPSIADCDAGPTNGGVQDVTTVPGGGTAAAGAANGNINGAVIVQSDGSAYAPSGTPQGTDAGGGTCLQGATCHLAAFDKGNAAMIGVATFKAAAPAPNCASFGPGADVAYCDLAGVQAYDQYLGGINATGVDAVGAELSGDDFTSAVAPDADFAGADLDDDNFTHADLSGDNLTDANLSFDTFNGTNLSGAQLAGANLSSTTSVAIVGVPASLPTGFEVVDGYLVGPHAQLGGANLTDANLSGADLEAAAMDDAILTGADVSGADFTNAQLSGVVSGGITGTPAVLPGNCFLVNGYLVTYSVNLTDVDLADAVMPGLSLGSGANLIDVNLSYADLDGGFLSANLSGSDLSHAKVYGASFYSADMPNVDLDNATTTDDDFSYADMSGDILTNDDFTDVSLLGANLSGADLAGVNWNNTVCPDATLSQNDGGTCINNLTPGS